ncbi:MAG TPA: MarR family transcriptional regulator [Vicinamibacteria bacterium]|nr:MarR family transcriptional regulator [Vicinamibacteria bacterium]
MRDRRTRLRLVPPVHRATHRIGLFLQASGLGVTQGEAHVLAHLAEVGACSIGQLHEAFAHRRSTLTSILDRLESRGLLQRELNPQDRRSFLVRPTPGGRALAARVHQALRTLEAEVLRRVSGAQLEAFAVVVAALAAAAGGDLPRR